MASSLSSSSGRCDQESRADVHPAYYITEVDAMPRRDVGDPKSMSKCPPIISLESVRVRESQPPRVVLNHPPSSEKGRMRRSEVDLTDWCARDGHGGYVVCRPVRDAVRRMLAQLRIGLPDLLTLRDVLGDEVSLRFILGELSMSDEPSVPNGVHGAALFPVFLSGSDQ